MDATIHIHNLTFNHQRHITSHFTCQQRICILDYMSKGARGLSAGLAGMDAQSRWSYFHIGKYIYLSIAYHAVSRIFHPYSVGFHYLHHHTEPNPIRPPNSGIVRRHTSSPQTPRLHIFSTSYINFTMPDKPVTTAPHIYTPGLTGAHASSPIVFCVRTPAITGHPRAYPPRAKASPITYGLGKR